MGYDRGDCFPFDFLNQMDFHLAQNRKENCHHNHIPFIVKENGNIVFSVQLPTTNLYNDHIQLFTQNMICMKYSINKKCINIKYSK